MTQKATTQTNPLGFFGRKAAQAIEMEERAVDVSSARTRAKSL